MLICQNDEKWKRKKKRARVTYIYTIAKNIHRDSKSVETKNIQIRIEKNEKWIYQITEDNWNDGKNKPKNWMKE